MKYFRKLNHAIDDAAFLAIKDEINHSEDLWLEDTSRQTIPAHRHTQTIYFRKFAQAAPGTKWEEIEDTEETTNMQRLPHLAKAINQFAELLDGRLARVICAKLNPLGVVPPHIDEGAYYAKRDRFHFVINSDCSLCGCGTNIIFPKEKELWWLDNKTIHFSVNLANTPRVHLIFDLMHNSGRSPFKDAA